MKVIKEKHFRLTRYISIVSLIAGVILAMTMLLVLRIAAINTVKELGEHINITLARTALNGVRIELSAMLLEENRDKKSGSTSLSLPEYLETKITDLISTTDIERIKLYNAQGTVIYSTKLEQIGKNQQDNPGFISAIRGEAKSKLIYHDDFNHFDEEQEEDNLIQTYLPIQKNAFEPVRGVFEIYTNVEPLIYKMELVQWFMLFITMLVFATFYLALMIFIRHASAIVDGKQQIIRERSNTLELLSAQMLTAQEEEKKNIANLLHEDIIQTLSAVKMRIENLSLQESQEKIKKEISSIVPFVQAGIQQIRSKATHIRPSSLDDLGIVETLTWYVRDLSNIFPDIKFRNSIELEEADVPRPLKSVIFRTVQDAVENIAGQTEADRVVIKLNREGNSINLYITENGRAYRSTQDSSIDDIQNTRIFSGMKERTILSGGEYNADSSDGGETIHISSWVV